MPGEYFQQIGIAYPEHWDLIAQLLSDRHIVLTPIPTGPDGIPTYAMTPAPADHICNSPDCGPCSFKRVQW